MGSNSFGTLFKITTWGESHGKAIGVVIDGCPAGLEISLEEIQNELFQRAPGRSPYTSPRGEKDRVEILSGLFEGKTTGAPISLLIPNHDFDSTKYESMKDVLKPGHASFTYLEKYGVFDYRGGSRASARETACRVAAGAIAKKFLAHYDITIIAYLKEVAGITSQEFSAIELNTLVKNSPLFCPDKQAERHMMEKIERVKEEGDSLGGIVELVTSRLPAGLGDPLYEKLDAKLASAMLSIPASKGIEFGAGFQSARMKGSQHNDLFTQDDQGRIITKSNHAGGILAGISTGMPLQLRVAFKPTSSIMRPQESLSIDKQRVEFQLPEGSRHDPCVAIRAVPVVEAMGALVLADALLMNASAKI